MGDKTSFSLRMDSGMFRLLKSEAESTNISFNRLCCEVLERYVKMTEPVEYLRMRLAIEATGRESGKAVNETKPRKRSRISATTGRSKEATGL